MCNYGGCNIDNYKDWNYCIFHLPKGDVPEEVKQELEKVDKDRIRELERFLALDEEDRKRIIEDFNKTLDNYIKEIERKIEEGDETISYNFVGFWFSEANFGGYKFKKHVNFEVATFSGDANFSGLFGGTTFSEGANFWYAKFGGNADFEGAEFSGDADFRYAKFHGASASFKMAMFSENGVADFTQISIGRNMVLYFTDASIKGIMVFQEIENLRAVMAGIRIFGNGQIRFIKTGLYYSSFIQVSETEKMSFMGVRWKGEFFDGIVEEKFFWCTNCSSLFIDTKGEGKFCPLCFIPNKGNRIYRMEKEELYDLMLSTYEFLRENYESHNRHVEAGEFYIMEMDARKKWLKSREKNRWIKRISDWGYTQMVRAYRWLSLYGESAILPVFWIVMSGIIFASVFSFTQNMGIFDALSASFLTLYQNPPLNMPPILALPERLLGLLLNALFILALNRKFKRRGRAQ